MPDMEANRRDVDADEAKLRPKASTAKRNILICIVVYEVLMVAGSRVFLLDGQVVNYILSLPVLISAAVWCVVDARQRNHELGILMRFSLIFLFVLAFPLYIFRTRGWRGFRSFSFLIIFAAAMIALLLRYL